MSKRQEQSWSPARCKRGAPAVAPRLDLRLPCPRSGPLPRRAPSANKGSFQAGKSEGDDYRGRPSQEPRYMGHTCHIQGWQAEQLPWAQPLPFELCAPLQA